MAWQPQNKEETLSVSFWRDNVSYQSMGAEVDMKKKNSAQARELAQAETRLGDVINGVYSKEGRLSQMVGITSLATVLLWIIQNEIANNAGDGDKSVESIVLLCIIALMTLVSIVLLWKSYICIYQIKTIRNVELEDAESKLSGLHESGLLEGLLFETFVLLIFPYPFFCGIEVTIESPYSGEANSSNPTGADYTNNTYFLTAILGVFMLMLRSYHIARVIAPISVFNPPGARAIAVAYDCEINQFMMFKEVINGSLMALMGLFLYLLVVFGYAVMVFDRVVIMDPPTNGIVGFSDALWMTLITMTTIGYGNMTPHTYGGRVIMGLACLSSLVVFAAIISQVINELTPSRRESKLGFLLERMQARSQLKEDSSNLIAKAWQVLKLRKKGANERQMNKARASLRRAAAACRTTRASLVGSVDDDVAVTAAEILYQVGYLNKDSETMRTQLDGLVKAVEDVQRTNTMLLDEIKQLQKERKPDRGLTPTGKDLPSPGFMQVPSPKSSFLKKAQEEVEASLSKKGSAKKQADV